MERGAVGTFFMIMVMEISFCNYGNWRTNESYKFSSISMEKLTPVEQTNLKQELDKRYKEREKRRQELHDEVAKDCEARFKKR